MSTVTEATMVLCDDVERDFECLRLMCIAVDDALEEHGRLGHSVVVMHDEKVLWLAPGEY